VILAAPPLELGRTAARDLVRRELLRPEYHRDDPSLLERLLRAVLDLARRVLAALHPRSTGLGWLAVLVLVLLVMGGVVVVGRRLGPLARSASSAPLFTGVERSAAEHRAQADAYAAAGRWRDAVRERWRALVRGLEERGLLEPRPGRTVAEAAREVAGIVPEAAPGLAAAARAFDEVWYAGVPAAAVHEALVRASEQQVRTGRPTAVTAVTGPDSTANSGTAR